MSLKFNGTLLESSTHVMTDPPVFSSTVWTKERQARLQPILDDLNDEFGIIEAVRDDFDSAFVNVLIRLDDDNSRGGSFDGRKPTRFSEPIRYIKSAIKYACKVHKVSLLFLDWPKLKYIYNGGKKVRDGYDQDYISIELGI
jgi:hypothetical protein